MKQTIIRHITLLLAGLLLFPGSPWAQLPHPGFKQYNLTELYPAYSAPHALSYATVHTVLSSETKTPREINVCTPTGYSADSTAEYPVMYLLDGSRDEDLLHVAGLFQFMDMMDMLPPHIVAGIANVNRRHDFTHPSTHEEDLKLIPDAGGSGAFIRFLRNEAQPIVSNAYKTNGHRTLIGQSLGGLLATQILLENPGLFHRYIIVSPSLWWANGELLASAAQKLKAWPQGPRPTRVYIAVGNEGPRMEKDAAKLAHILRAAHITGLHISFMRFPKESHGTILHNALYQILLRVAHEKKDPLEF